MKNPPFKYIIRNKSPFMYITPPPPPPCKLYGPDPPSNKN